MARAPGPWEPRNTVPRPPSRLRAWLIALAAVGAFILALMFVFPEVRLTTDREMNLVYLGTALAFVGSSAFARRIPWTETARNLALWALVAGVLAVVYLYSDTLTGIGARMLSGLAPSEPVAAADGAIALTADQDGNFAVTGKANGTRVHFAVDTGASDIVLSPDDARRAGIDMAALRYGGETATANGEGHVAYARLASLDIGPAHYEDVPVAVNQAPMDDSLLGMAFLRRLKSFSVEGHTLTLRWR